MALPAIKQPYDVVYYTILPEDYAEEYIWCE
jgi:hypothetical protein